MLTEAELLELVKTHRSADVQRLGPGNVRTIVEDFVALGPSETRFERPDGGHHFDLMDSMALLVGVLQLFVAVGDIIVRERRRRIEEESKETLIHRIEPELSRLDFSQVPDRDSLVADVVELVRRRGN